MNKISIIHEITPSTISIGQYYQVKNDKGYILLVFYVNITTDAIKAVSLASGLVRVMSFNELLSDCELLPKGTVFKVDIE